jgi:hypothetical protein
MGIIDRRWENQMDHPLYGAALYLNPGKLHPLIEKNDDATVGQLRGSFIDVLDRMVEDKDTRDKIRAQSLDYEALREVLSKKSAKENMDNMSPHKCCFLFNSSSLLLFLIQFQQGYFSF